MAFSILKEVTRAERALANGGSDHVDSITMAAAYDILHGRVTAAATLVGEGAMIGIAEGASMWAGRVSCGGTLAGNGGGETKTEGGFNIGKAESFSAAVCKKYGASVGEDANVGGER